jgi:putative peptidoglycan lipid II flippase
VTYPAEPPSAPPPAPAALHPGDVLAGRYRIEDLIGEVGGSQIWRAKDDVLNRSVGAQVLPASDPRAVAFLDAARASTAVTDPRFLRVLDVSEDERGHAYVVREWARAMSLASLLRQGPLDNRRAAAIVAEAASAIEAAHEVGRTHRRLDPSTVLVKDSGAVRIAGLGTDYALLGSAEVGDQPLSTPVGGLSAVGLAPRTPVGAVEAAEQEDVQALGRLLYACLVARWPGGGPVGLPPAPTEHGRLLRPRQVRAGVSRDADTVCDRVLGRPPRHHQQPLRTAHDLAEALAFVGHDAASSYDDQPSLTDAPPDPFRAPDSGGASAAAPAPALLPATRPPRRTAPQHPDPVTLARSRASARASIAGDRKWIWLAVALLVAVTSVIAFAVGRATNDSAVSAPPPSSRSPAGPDPVTEAPDRPLRVAEVTDFDPDGDGTEQPELTDAAIDGNKRTSWETVDYFNNPELGGLKRGVGLLLDLGSPQLVSELEIRFGNTPTSYSVYAAPADRDRAPTALEQLDRVDTERDAGPVTAVAFREPLTTRYLLVWLTSLPEESESTYVGVIDEITIRGQVR